MHRIAAFFATLVLLLPVAATASESSETIDLAYLRPHRPVVQPSQAHRLLADVNAAREQRGLPPLVEDPQLSRFALEVAEQMATRHYFGHTDPDGVTFEDRVRSSGLRFRYAAENMAFDEDEAHANEAFLTSPGHYANIVDRHPRYVGTAVVSAGDGEVFFVEEFAS
ncbi:MAG TPA: CAP domain-containing protein [Candidatus Baltobacteraceae bacterium]|nr:CAP domain-containing protein [Candidatus Baltobacteraceae bacterium]